MLLQKLFFHFINKIQTSGRIVKTRKSDQSIDIFLNKKNVLHKKLGFHISDKSLDKMKIMKKINERTEERKNGSERKKETKRWTKEMKMIGTNIFSPQLS